jgi:membrane associated rhomboid family serine protease
MLRTLEELKRAPGSWSIAVLLLAVHAWVESRGGYQSVAWLYEMAGLSRASLREGHYAAPLTYVVLHGSWMHAVCNALMVLFLGARVENLLGAKPLARAIIGGTLLGGLMHLLLSGESTALLVGASAAAMALLLLMTTLSPQSRMFPLPLSAGNVGLGVMISSLLLMLLDPEAGIPFVSEWGKSLSWMFGKNFFRIGHACHFGGALCGFLLGRWILRRPVTLAELQRQRREGRRDGGWD